MDAQQAAALLAKTPLFADLEPSELLRLGALARRRAYGKGDYIFHQGDAGDALFVLMDGRVKVATISEDGDEMILATLQPPDVFGELALIDGGPRSGSIQTLEPTTALTLTRATLLDLVNVPTYAMSLSRFMKNSRSWKSSAVRRSKVDKICRGDTSGRRQRESFHPHLCSAE